MLQTTHKTTRELDGTYTHYIWVYDEDCELLDIIEMGSIGRRRVDVNSIHSIIKNK